MRLLSLFKQKIRILNKNVDIHLETCYIYFVLEINSLKGGVVVDRTQQALKAFVSLKRVADYFDQATRRDVASCDINVNEFAALELLYHKGPLTVQQIKERILIAHSSTTYIIDQLCRKNLAERRRCGEDKRVIYVHLTAEGLAFIQAKFPQHAEMLTQLFHRLTDDELATLHRLLKKTTGRE